VTKFETFVPQRRGRAHDIGPQVRLTARTGSNGGGTLRLTREALLLLGISAKHGDHHYFLVEVDREDGALRLTPTEDVFMGRQMNPVNRQISLAQSFFDWTGWKDSHWVVEARDGALCGDVRVELPRTTRDQQREVEGGR
jgi:hypothetical protein